MYKSEIEVNLTEIQNYVDIQLTFSGIKLENM